MFQENLDSELARLQRDLLAGTISVGEYHQFVIYDPKQRTITAPSFHERVLHHAIMNVCKPVLERWLIADTFACRIGKGRLAALARATIPISGWPGPPIVSFGAVAGTTTAGTAGPRTATGTIPRTAIVTTGSGSP